MKNYIKLFFIVSVLWGSLAFSNSTVFATINMTGTPMATYNDNVVIAQGDVVDLKGKEVVINGDLNVQGQLYIDGGKLSVKGNMTVEGVEGTLKMISKDDHVIVEKDFTTKSGTSSTGLLTDGVLEVKGNFNQKTGSFYYSPYWFYKNDNFAASGNHKTILSGSFKTVNFDNPYDSHFANVEIKAGTEFTAESKLAMNCDLSNNFEITIPALYYSGSLCGNKLIVNGNLMSDTEGIDLKGGTMQVNGSAYIDGLLYIDNGKMTVMDNMTVEGINGSLKMIEKNDSVTVAKDFTEQSGASSAGLLTDGVLEVKGNFKQKTGNFYFSPYWFYKTDNFVASGNHKTILSGTTKTVKFENPYDSHFSDLEIKEGSKFTEDSNISMNYSFNNDYTIEIPTVYYSGSLQGHKLTVNGSMVSDTEGIDLKGGTLQVSGSAMIDGLLDIDKGKMLVKGNMSVENIQGALKMIYKDDYVSVGGSYTQQNGVSGIGLMTDGVLEVNGDFTEKTGDFYYSPYWLKCTDNFSASGNHLTILSGDQIQKVSFDNPDKSRFSKFLTINKNFQFSTNVYYNEYYTTIGKDKAGQYLFNDSYVKDQITVNKCNGNDVVVNRNNDTYEWPTNGIFTEEGSYQISAGDKIGTTVYSFNIDRTPPGIEGTQIKKDGQNLIISGNTEKGSQVSLYSGLKILTQGIANDAGDFSLKTNIPDADTKLNVYAIDKTGNKSNAVSFIIDVTPPKILGISNVTTKSKIITGKTEANAMVQVYLGNSLLVSGKADENGNFKLSIKKSLNKRNKLNIYSMDQAGNKSSIRKAIVN